MVDIERQATLKVGLPLTIHTPKNPSRMSHLINAALVDQEWCELLLEDPSAALAKGPHGEFFDLAPRARQFVLNAGAASLAEFAQGWLNYCKF